jgi:predicted outer membrane repeat protein
MVAWQVQGGTHAVVSDRVVLDFRDYTLTVASPYQTPTPAVGMHPYPWRSTVTCRAAGDGLATQSPVGWTGTGSVPATGLGWSTGAFVLDEVAGSTSSSITWRWLPSQDDPDCDGFSNLWESHFGTDPNNPADYPREFTTVPVVTTSAADLQAALSAAPAFSRVLLKAGLYVGNLTVGTSLLIEGQDGFATVCDGNMGGTVFTVTSDAHVLFRSLVVQRGRSALGAGINGQAARFMGIIGTKVDRNSATPPPAGGKESGSGGDGMNGGDGGGIYVGNTATLLDSTLSNNSALEPGDLMKQGRGGAAYGSTAGYIRIRNTEVTHNSVLTAGGGVYLDQSCGADIVGSSFSNNSAGKELPDVQDIGLGGGLYVNDNCTVTIGQTSFDRNNAQGLANRSGFGAAIYAGQSGLIRAQDMTLLRNRAWKDGGAVCARGSAQLFMRDAVFDQNHADRNGGAIATSDSSNVTVDNVLAKGGFSGQLGGGFYISDSSVLTITNGTVVGNTAADRGGGVTGAEVGATIELRNTIVHGNRAGIGYPQIARLMSADIRVEFCLIEGGYAGTGNVSGAPGFVSAGAWHDGGTPTNYDDDWWEDGDYRLTSASRARDAGSNSFVAGDVTTDLDGRERIFNDTVDMGTYEYFTVTHATDDAYATSRNQALSIPAPGVLANDTVPVGRTLTAIRVADPVHGTLSLNNNGSFLYMPSSGFLGTDSFTYTANDGTVNSNAATVTISVTAGGLATVTLGDLSQVYDGTGKRATARTVPPDLSVLLTYNGTTAPPVNAGTYEVIATVTDAGYSGITEGALVIAKAVPVISWPAPAPMVQGMALSAARLNATVNVPGSFAYTPPAGVVLAAGNHTMSVVFTPGDTANWTSAAATTILTVIAAEMGSQFSVVFLDPANPAGRCIWDFTGSYAIGIGAHTMQLDLLHDTDGRMTGAAWLAGPMPSGSDASIPLTARGKADCRGGLPFVALSLSGRGGPSRANLKLALALAGRNLDGVYTGSVADQVGGREGIGGACALPIDPSMDGQFQLALALDRRSQDHVTGFGILTLANGRQIAVQATGKEAAGLVILRVGGDGAMDPLFGAVNLRLTLRALSSNSAEVLQLGGRAFGQSLRWP